MVEITDEDYRKTMDFLEKLSPRISYHNYETFRDNLNSPKLDIRVTHPNGEKTR